MDPLFATLAKPAHYHSLKEPGPLSQSGGTWPRYVRHLETELLMTSVKCVLAFARFLFQLISRYISRVSLKLRVERPSAQLTNRTAKFGFYKLYTRVCLECRRDTLGKEDVS